MITASGTVGKGQWDVVAQSWEGGPRLFERFPLRALLASEAKEAQRG